VTGLGVVAELASVPVAFFGVVGLVVIALGAFRELGR
jgi:hypothetical protein